MQLHFGSMPAFAVAVSSRTAVIRRTLAALWERASATVATVLATRGQLSNVGWMLAERVWMLLSGVVIGFWVIRALGPDDFGKFSAALSLTAVLGGLATVGLDTVVVRRLTSSRHDTAKVLVAAAGLRIVGSLCLTLLSWIGARLLFPASPEVADIALVVAASALFRVTDVVGLWLQAENQFGRAARARIMVRVAGDVIRVALILNDSGVLWFAYAALAESAVACLLFGVIGWKFWSQPGHVDYTIARSLFANGRPVMVSGLVSALYSRVDQFVLFNVAGAEANGHYAAAVRISEAFVVLLVSISSVAASHFGRMATAPAQQVDRDLRRYYRSMLISGLAVSALMSMAARPIVLGVYGANFEATVPVLRVHAWTFALVAASVGLEPWFYHHGRLTQYVPKTLITLLFCLPAVLVSTHFFGPVGAAAAVVATYAMSVFVTNVLLPGARDAFRFQVRAFQRH